MTKDEILEGIKGLTALELADLVSDLEETFGVSAAAPVAVAAPGAAAAADGGAAEKDEFDVVLEAFGDNKIAVIKVVREVTDKGLKEAKELVEGAPCNVAEGVKKEEAEDIKAKFEEAGATITLK